MSEPPRRRYQINLVPNKDDDDPKRIEALKATLEHLAKAADVEIHTDASPPSPGDTEPNPERAEKFREETNQALVEASSEYFRDHETEEERAPDGALIRRAREVVRSRRGLKVNLSALGDLASGVWQGGQGVVSIVCKAVTWVKDKLSKDA